MCIPKNYKCLVEYSMVYHSKATYSALLEEIVGLLRMFEISQRLPKATEDVLLAELVGFPRIVFFGSS